jgi:nucleoside-diphosphate-sugar epimerase
MIRIVGSQGIIGKHLSYELSTRGNLIVHQSKSWDFDFPPDLTGDVIFFLRAVSSPFYVAANPGEAFETNVIKTRLAIEDMLEKGARVIFASSDVVYGDTGINIVSENTQTRPFGEYAFQKSLIEEYFRGKVNFVSVRLSTVVGEGSKLRERLLNQGIFEVFHPLIRNPIHIKDVLVVLERLIHSDFGRNFPNGVLNLGGIEAMTSYDLTLLEAEALGLNSPRRILRSKLDKLARPGVVRMDSKMAEEFANLRFDLRRHYS